MVAAYLGLFLALGGASYAAVSLPASSVGTKQLKANAVISSKVKNRSLVAADLKTNQIPPGPTGPTGAAGIGDFAPGPPIALAAATPSCQTQPGSLCQSPVIQDGDPRWLSYSQFDAVYPPAAYFQDKAGYVHLQGAAMFLNPSAVAGLDFPIFYLPVALRPTDGLSKFVVSRCDGAGAVPVVVGLNGGVKPEPFQEVCLSLDGISFHP